YRRDLTLHKNNQHRLKLAGFYAYGEKAEELSGKVDSTGTGSWAYGRRLEAGRSACSYDLFF
ncbi:MAG: hypothetical protein QUS12_15265, partial [Methanosarcina sp.]|nr:hypothetical protein [Methanosarcina sp.]